MTRIRRLRLVLPARFAHSGGAAAREIAERFADEHFGAAAMPATQDITLRLPDTGQTAAQIGLQAAFAARGKTGTGRGEP